MKKILSGLLAGAMLTLAAGAMAENLYTPGTYTGVGTGRHGEMTVEVTVSADKIESINVVSENETKGIADLPLERIPQEVVMYQSLGVDNVTGATITSAGLKLAITDALKQAGADVDALRKVPVEKEVAPVADMETTVVVAGGGMGGLMTAAVAAYNGLDVVLVEKLPFVGGSLIVAGGGMITGNSEAFKEQGIDDNVEATMAWAHEFNKGAVREPDYDFVEYVVSQTGKTVDDYYIKAFGMPSRLIMSTYPRARFGEAGDTGYGAQETARMKEVILEHGGTILTDTAAKEIVMEDGKAVGLKVSAEGGDFEIRADKVVIACGGANHNKEMMTAVTPQLAYMTLDDATSIGNTGDGYAMLEAVGAKMGEGPYIKSSNVMFSQVFGYSWRDVPSTTATLIFDANGVRYMDEGVGIVANRKMIDHASPASYALFDAATMDEKVKADFDRFAEPGSARTVVYGQTIEEIAQKLGIDADVLSKTFDRYQTLCAKGSDPDQGKEAAQLVAYTGEAGYYAAFVQPGAWGTFGGALTDYNFRVLNAETDEPIENLYAVGECATSTLFGVDYMGSWSLGYYSTAGHIAAETIQEELGK